MTMDESHSTDHRRRGGGRARRRLVLWSLSLILLFTIPLCLLVIAAPPKIIVFWWAEDYGQDYDDLTTPTTRKLTDFKGNRISDFEFHSKKENFEKTSEKKSKKDELPKILLISYDAFRWDYIQKNNATPTFRWLIKNGVFATEGLKNTFITITAPNHYGIVTGLYEEVHGVVANNFYAPEFNETFNYFDDRQKTDPRLFLGEPIWVTNDKAGQGRATGCQMWTGCDIKIEGRLPKHYTSWDGDLSWIIRVDSIITWFKDPVDPINLGLLYVEEPDETGHLYGPDDPKTAAMVQKLDQLTAYLLWRLYTEDLLDKVNLIFTADHGMASVPWANVVNLDEHVNKSLYTVYGGTPNWNVLPVPGAEQEIYDTLYNKVPHLIVYNKTTIPEDYHYTNTPHVLPLQFVAELHWRLAHNDTSVSKDAKEMPTYERMTRGRMLKRKLEISNATVGEHGYNNSITDMHPYFIAHGPAFKQGYNITQFMNIDIYPLMCHILGVEPAPNNGSFDRVSSILKDGGHVKTFGKHIKNLHLEDWAKPYAYESATTAPVPEDFTFKVARHYLPFSYSINFDIFVMTLLLCLYVATMIVLSQRIRRGRRQDVLPSARIDSAQRTDAITKQSKNGDKYLVIDVVA